MSINSESYGIVVGQYRTIINTLVAKWFKIRLFIGVREICIGLITALQWIYHRQWISDWLKAGRIVLSDWGRKMSGQFGGIMFSYYSRTKPRYINPQASSALHCYRGYLIPGALRNWQPPVVSNSLGSDRWFVASWQWPVIWNIIFNLFCFGFISACRLKEVSWIIKF